MPSIDPNAVIAVLAMIVGAVAAFAGAYAATKSEIRHLWRELGRIDGRSERAHERIDGHEAWHRNAGAR